MLTLDANQRAILESARTSPVYLISTRWAAAAARWSTIGDMVVDGHTYSGGIAGVRSADDWRTASISIVPDQTSADWLLSGAWRGEPCDISLLPYRTVPGIVEDGYFEDGYGSFGDAEVADPIPLISGIISAGEYSGNGPITLSVRHRAQVGKWAPRIRLLPPITNHLPVPGTRFSWAGEAYILEAR